MNRNRTLWAILLVGLLVVVCCCMILFGLITLGNVIGNVSLPLGAGTEAVDESTHTLAARAPLTLAIDVPVGNITVRPGGDGQVTVVSSKHAWGRDLADARRRLEDIQVDLQGNDSQVRVQVTGLAIEREIRRSPRLDLTITVPQQTSVEVRSSVGDIALGGLRGDVQVRADVGTVKLTDVTPSTQLTVASRVANVEFDGSLAPGAGYEFTSDIGRIVLRLPAQSSFSLDARSDIGNVRTGFAVSGRSAQGVVGKELQGNVGSGPGARLYLRSRVGEISIDSR